MEYNGAQTEAGTNTPAETWQIDFTARMAGMDERQRLENVDIYGAAAFSVMAGWSVKPVISFRDQRHRLRGGVTCATGCKQEYYRDRQTGKGLAGCVLDGGVDQCLECSEQDYRSGKPG
ncbi:MAG: hypothetical protein ACLR2M_00290 [Varibaculum sp.]